MNKKRETKTKESIFKKFELNNNNIRSLLTSIRVFVAIITIILMVFIIKSIFFNKKVTDYPMIYNKKGGELVLINKKDKTVSLSSNDSIKDVLYANKTNKYVLFVKNSSLYLYKANKKDETIKIMGNVKKYYFSPNDKYIVSVDEDDNLYVYNYKKNEKIVSDIKEVKAVTDDEVIYLKDGKLCKRSLKYNKEEVKKIDDNFGRELTLLNNKILIYLDSNKTLKLYNLKNEDTTKIDEDVSAYYASDDLEEFYYLTLDSTLYYYDGTKSNKVANDIYDVASVDVENKEIVYSKYDKKYSLYFQKGTKEASVIEKDLKNNINYVFINNRSAVYYINKDNDLMFARINGAKVGKSRTVISDVESLSFRKTEKGFAFLADSTKKGLGTLYITNSYKAKKIDSDVIANNLKVSNDGKIIYYFKDYAGNSGDLYYSKGGKPKLIDEDVSKYQYVRDKEIYYIKDYNKMEMSGDLYKYSGKIKKIDDKVSNLINVGNEYNE